jgi:hypothetical protein
MAQGQDVKIDVPPLVFRGVHPPDVTTVVPELVFEGYVAPRLTVNVTGLTFRGVSAPDITTSVPELVFQGYIAPDVTVDVSGLLFRGVNAPGVEVNVNGLLFQGVNGPDVAVDVPELMFQGYIAPDVTVDVAGLLFRGVSAPDQTVSVPELVFQGYVAPNMAVDVPGLLFRGVSSPNEEVAVTKLVFRGVGADEEPEEETRTDGAHLSFEASPGRPSGVSRDRRISIHQRVERVATPNIRRLTAQVYLRGDYLAPRRGGHEIVLTLREGKYDPREVRFRRVPDLTGDNVTTIEIDISLRGSTAIPPGRWPESDETNDRTWYRYVTVDAQLEDGLGQVVDQIGSYCYDAAQIRFVGMGQCDAEPAPQRLQR